MKPDYLDSLLKEIDDDSDGYFTIEQNGEFAQLTVYPAGKKGKKVDLNTVKKRVRLLAIDNVELQRVNEAVEKESGKPVTIGRWPVQIPEDAQLELEISEDNMHAWATMSPPRHGGIHPGQETIRMWLAANHIRMGIIDEAVTKLAETKEYLSKVLVARGKEPIQGKNGSIKVFFETNMKPRPAENAKGQVDYRELNLIQSVEAEELLAQVFSPEPGEDGFDVLGHVLPARTGNEAEIQAGANARPSPDGSKIFSNIMGRPVLESGGVIRVDEIIRLDQVDFSTGNVDFPGTIIVEERMLDGFKLTTRGSIYIKSSVGKVFLKAEKDIILAGGFMGRGAGRIEADGDIHARFVEQGHLKAGRSIRIEEAAMHSELIAGISIILRGGRGDLIGGETIAGESVICTRFGAAGETKTRAIVGTPPELIEELNSLQEDRRNRNITLEKVALNRKSLLEKSRRTELNEEENEALRKLTLIEEKYTSMLKNIELQLETARSSFEPSPSAAMLIEREIFPACEVQFGRGRTYRSGQKNSRGPLALYLDESGELMQSNSLPDTKK
ncbi:MAG: DUF342 domain-containing protein [Leptospiraceae bacterium]|nr:DUF342 domain-containing protein [Leptospiraceae bacterium]